jgi:hypothetical protein
MPVWMVDFLLDPNGPKLLIGFCWNAYILLKDMAGTTGLEPAASAVTVGHKTVIY